MLQVSVTNIDDGQLIAKISEALQVLGKDIAARPDVTTKRVATVKISLTPAESYIAVDTRCPECGELCQIVPLRNEFGYVGTHCTHGLSGTHRPFNWGEPVSDCCEAPIEPE